MRPVNGAYATVLGASGFDSNPETRQHIQTAVNISNKTRWVTLCDTVVYNSSLPPSNSHRFFTSYFHLSDAATSSSDASLPFTLLLNTFSSCFAPSSTMLFIEFLHHILAFASSMPPGVDVNGPFQDRIFGWSNQRALVGATQLHCAPSLFFPTSTACAAPAPRTVTTALPPWKPEILIDKSVATSLFQDLHILQCSDYAFEPEPFVLPSCSVIPKGLGFYLFCEDVVEPEAHTAIETLVGAVDAVSMFLMSSFCTTASSLAALPQFKLVYTLVLSTRNSVATLGLFKSFFSFVWSPAFFVIFPTLASIVWTFVAHWIESSSSISKIQVVVRILASSVEHLLRKYKDYITGLIFSKPKRLRIVRTFNTQRRCIVRTFPLVVRNH